MAKAISPGVKVHSPMGKVNAETTHGGIKNQKPESHYDRIVDSAVNHADEQSTYSAKRKR